MGDALLVLGISGSLRKGSYNTALLRAAAAKDVLPDRMQMEMADIAGLPLYNEDVRAAGLPPAVVTLREQMLRADAILIVTPEYNYSVPGVLKNAIDWASRPPNQPMAGKPLGLMGVSAGPGGTLRAQYHLRQIAVFLDLHPLNKPEVFVRNAQALFDAEGRLTDEPTRKLVRQHLEALSEWTWRLRRSPVPSAP